MTSIQETYDYDQFDIGDFNRNIKTTNLKKIEKSVKENGWLQHPVIVNEKMQVIDGQHRLYFAKNNRLPVYYVVIPGLTVNDCVTMNNTRTGWGLEDYIQFYANQGNHNYTLLNDLINRYTFLSVSGIVSIALNRGYGGSSSQGVKTGELQISSSEYNKALEILDFLNDLSKYVLAVKGRAIALFTAIAFAYECKGVSKARLAKQVKNYIGIITPPATIDMALNEIEKLYNYRIPKESYIYIATEYKKQAADRMAHGIKRSE